MTTFYAVRRQFTCLGSILDGIAVMKVETKRAEGAVKIVQALDLYGANLNHAGWNPLKHQVGDARVESAAACRKIPSC